MESLKELLHQAQQGDVEAVEQIVDEYSGLIENECAKFGLWQLPELSHSDLSQQVVFRVLTKLDQFHGATSDNPQAVFEQWIRVTARNVCKNLLRDKTAPTRCPDKPVEKFDEVTQTYYENRPKDRTASSILMRDEEAERLQRIIAECLDEMGQKILNLRVVEGLSLKEISERLPLTYDQVRYKFDTSLAELKKQLGDQF